MLGKSKGSWQEKGEQVELVKVPPGLFIRKAFAGYQAFPQVTMVLALPAAIEPLPITPGGGLDFKTFENATFPSDMALEFFFNCLQTGGEQMGKGLLPNMLSMGWGAYMYLPQFPPEMYPFFSHQNPGGGERREVAKSQVWGKWSLHYPILALDPTT